MSDTHLDIDTFKAIWKGGTTRLEQAQAEYARQSSARTRAIAEAQDLHDRAESCTERLDELELELAELRRVLGETTDELEGLTENQQREEDRVMFTLPGAVVDASEEARIASDLDTIRERYRSTRRELKERIRRLQDRIKALTGAKADLRRTHTALLEHASRVVAAQRAAEDDLARLAAVIKDRTFTIYDGPFLGCTITQFSGFQPGRLLVEIELPEILDQLAGIDSELALLELIHVEVTKRIRAEAAPLERYLEELEREKSAGLDPLHDYDFSFELAIQQFLERPLLHRIETDCAQVAQDLVAHYEKNRKIRRKFHLKAGFSTLFGVLKLGVAVGRAVLSFGADVTAYLSGLKAIYGMVETLRDLHRNVDDALAESEVELRRFVDQVRSDPGKAAVKANLKAMGVPFLRGNLVSIRKKLEIHATKVAKLQAQSEKLSQALTRAIDGGTLLAHRADEQGYGTLARQLADASRMVDALLTDMEPVLRNLETHIGFQRRAGGIVEAYTTEPLGALTKKTTALLGSASLAIDVGSTTRDLVHHGHALAGLARGLGEIVRATL